MNGRENLEKYWGFVKGFALKMLKNRYKTQKRTPIHPILPSNFADFTILPTYESPSNRLWRQGARNGFIHQKIKTLHRTHVRARKSRNGYAWAMLPR
jgi:hypothetical protein